jgi:hypothetical protein
VVAAGFKSGTIIGRCSVNRASQPRLSKPNFGTERRQENDIGAAVDLRSKAAILRPLR